MNSIRSEVGALSGLFAFEAAGRLGGFTRAAAELGVTQAAVSKQISTLEANLGRALFIRHARRVELSPAGKELFETVTMSLSAIAARMQALRETEPRPLTVALSIAMSQFWLMPILSQFTEAHPEIAIRILSQDDLAQVRGADIVIRFMADAPSGAIRLLGAEVQAMATADFLVRHPVESAEKALRVPLIAYDSPDESWLTWKDWAHSAGLNAPVHSRTLSVTRYQDAIVAAQRAQGLVLAWKLNGQPLSFGADLVPVPGPVMRPQGAFWLMQTTPAHPDAAAFVGWILALVHVA